MYIGDDNDYGEITPINNNADANFRTGEPVIKTAADKLPNKRGSMLTKQNSSKGGRRAKIDPKQNRISNKTESVKSINPTIPSIGSKQSVANMNSTQDDITPGSRAPKQTGSFKTKINKNQIVIDDSVPKTQENLFVTAGKSRQASREDIEGNQNSEKSGTAKRLPPGVRLYNQSKGKPKNKNGQKFKDEGPPKPVLTKSVELMLIQSNREKCEEIIKNSNEIHDTLKESKIDKESMINALFSDSLFNHVLANLLFHAKILGKNKLEGFLHDRIKKFIREYETDRKIKENLCKRSAFFRAG